MRPANTRTSLLLFVGASVVTARTEREARELLAEYRRHASVEGALAHAAASLGIDFGRYGMDEPIEASSTQAIRSNVEAITASLGPGWSKRQLIDRFVLGSRQPPIVGSPEQVADQLIAWVNEADVDGFNLSRAWRVSLTWCYRSSRNAVPTSAIMPPAPTGRSCSTAANGCLASIRRRWHAGSNKEGVGRLYPVRRDQSSLRWRSAQ